jgi:predicted O-linked N-acetylglucosamine transferase (SPINDLY family)
VQVVAGGHYATSGIDAMDYLITDRFHSPEGAEELFSEMLVRLPNGYTCYRPPDYAPPVLELPARANGFVTFGCYNNLSKITPDVIALWAELLTRVPTARLRLQTAGLNDAETQQRYRTWLQNRDVEWGRVDLHGEAPYTRLLGNYSLLDVALDPFPYSGGLTTCESLWMGVPVVTLTGHTFCGRHSTSHLSNVGLEELVARDRSEYLDLATGLATDLPRLEAIRRSLRSRMTASPLCDGPRQTRNLEAAYRHMWRDWCATSTSESFAGDGV